MNAGNLLGKSRVIFQRSVWISWKKVLTVWKKEIDCCQCFIFDKL